MVKSVTIDRLPVTGTVNDSDLLIVRSVADGVTRQVTKLQLFGELTEDVGDVLENYGARSIVPALDGAYDLGSVDKTWRDLYIDGTLYAGNIVGQLDSSITFDSGYFRSVLDSDFILSLTAGAFSGIVSRIDLDSDRLDAQISRITDLSLNLSALDSDYAAYKIATADAFDELYVRIYLDSDRLSTVAGDLTQLQTNVSNLDLLAFDSAGVAAMIDSATSIVRSELISRIDVTDSSVLILAGDISDLQVQALLLDSAIGVNGSAISELTTRIELDSDRLSIVSSDVTSLQASLSNLDVVDSAAILGIVDSAVSNAVSQLTARIDADSDSLTLLTSDVTTLQNELTLLEDSVAANSVAVSSLTSRIDLDSDRLSLLSSDVTTLSNTVTNLQLSGIDSDLVGALIDSAVSNAVTTLTSRIDADSDSLSLVASRVTDLENEVRFDSSSIATSDAYTSLVSRIDLDSDRLSSTSEDLTSLRNTLFVGDSPGTGINTSVFLASSAYTVLFSNVVKNDSDISANSALITQLQNEVRFDSASVATTDAYQALVSRIDVDSSALQLLSQDVTSLSNTVSGLSGYDSDLFVASTAYGTLTSQISTNASGISSVSSDVVNLQNSVTGLQDSIDANSTAITNLTSRIDADSSSLALLSQDVTDLANTVSGITGFDSDVLVASIAYGALTSQITANENSITSVSNDIISLQNTLSGLQDSVTANSSAITDLTSRINADSDSLVLLSQDVTTLSNTVSGLSGYDSDLFVASTAYSGLTSSISTNASGISAAVSDISSLTLAVSGLEDSVTNVATLAGGFDGRITANENSITSIEARWFVDLNVNGHIAGIELLNTGTTSNFNVVADNFKVINASNNEIQPFTVNGDVVEMSNVVAKNINVVDQTATGRTTITGDGIKIESSTNGTTFVTRVKLGNLSAL